MANVQFGNTGIDMSSQQFVGLVGIIEENPTAFAVQENNGDVLVFRGQFDYLSNGALSSGTISSFAQYGSDISLIYSYSGIEFPIVGYFSYLSASDFQGMSAYLLAGDDIIDGGTAGEVINGYGGNDVIYGNEGDDYIFGLDGNDVLDGGPGNDYMEGGDGDDTYYVGDVGDRINESVYSDDSNHGYDSVFFTEKYLVIPKDIEYVEHVGSGPSVILTITGADTHNTNIVGGSGVDTVAFGRDYESYDISQDGDVTNVSGPDGYDYLTNIENIEFANGTFDVPGWVFSPLT
jgi:Ca2+-binding RTX toxin-like protein